MSAPTDTGPRWRRLLALAWLGFLLLVSLLANWLPLPYAAGAADLAHLAESPLAAVAYSRHWLGTDPLGRDLLASLIFGARTTLLVSLPAAVLATVLGGLLGSIAGFWGNTTLRAPLAYWLAVGIILLTILLHPDQFFSLIGFCWLLALTAGSLAVAFAARRLPVLRRRVALPADQLILAAVALLESIPRLVLVLAVAAVQEASVFSLLVVLSLTYWTGPARLIRADLLRVKALPYIEAGRAAGLPGLRILLRHALPNASRAVRTAFPLSVAALIGLETTLSFLGIGLPAETPSWGRVLATARLEPTAWWLVAEPGLLLLFTMLALRQLANSSRGNS